MTEYEATTSLFRFAFRISDTPSHPRDAFRPSFAWSLHPLVQEGAGKAGCRRHPRSAARKCSAGKPHSSIQAKPNTRPSLRGGLTAYAVLSREPNSFWPPSPRRFAMRLTRLGAPHLRDKLDRSDDGRDHTVLPYARPPDAKGSRSSVHTRRKNVGETNFTAPLIHTRFRAHRDYPPCPHPSCRRCRVHRKPGSRSVTTYDRPSRSSRDAQHIRQFRISVKWNIFTGAD